MLVDERMLGRLDYFIDKPHMGIAVCISVALLAYSREA
jgi:hypothetical protein